MLSKWFNVGFFGYVGISCLVGSVITLIRFCKWLYHIANGITQFEISSLLIYLLFIGLFTVMGVGILSSAKQHYKRKGE